MIKHLIPQSQWELEMKPGQNIVELWTELDRALISSDTHDTLNVIVYPLDPDNGLDGDPRVVFDQKCQNR